MTPPTLLAARAGFEAPGAEDFYWQPIWELHLFGVDLSINRTVLIIFLATALVVGLFLVAFRKPKLVPRGIQNVMESGVEFVREQVIVAAMGPSGMRYLPYLTALFFFVFACSVFEVVPLVNFPATSRFSIPLFLAMFSWVLFIVAGVRANGAGKYLKNTLFPPGIPWYILFLLTPIELFSTFIVRPATLAIRLTANMIAGHLMLTVLFLGTHYLLTRQLTFGFGLLSLGASSALVGFEIFVAGLQAFIFTMLTAVYIAGSVESDH
jgi:F-type H+-transporting ATPase subunit a